EFSGRFNFNVCIYIVAIAEHVIGNFLQAAICYEDKALTENVIRASTVEVIFVLCVDELCSFLHTCLEQMNLLIRVFREPILSVNPSSSTAGTSSYEQQTTTCTHTNEDNTQVLFGNILDVYNNMRILLDTIEAEDEDNYSPNIVKSKNNCTLLTSSTTPSSGMLNIVKPLNTSNNSTLITSGNDKTTLMDSLSETLTTLESIPEKRFPSDDDRNEMKNNIEHNNECSHRNISNNNSSGSIFHSPTLTDHTFSNDDNYDDLGICLIELAEDDSLHAFSRYANIVLDSNSRDRVWNLIEHENYAQELCQLSRTIVHTASLNNKYPGYNFFSSSTTTTTPVVDFHSFTCLHCQHWDTVVSKPRRRSTSTTATPLNDDNNYFNVHNNKNTMSTSVDSADKFDLTSNMSLNRHHHRSPHLLEMNTTSYAINCNYLTLHRCAYDEVDRARLEDVLSMLRKTRATLERDLAKHPWVALHLVRLISTGQLTDRYRSLYLNAVSGASCPPSPVNYTAPPSPVGLSNQIGSHVSCASMSSTNCNASSSNIFNYHNTHHSTPTTAITTTSISINSTDLSFTYGNTVQNKAEEIEKLLSSKDKLIMSSNYLNTLGDFVMESRIHLRTTDSKKSSSEYIAYLFTGLLLICKWQERRSTPLNPNSVQQSILRIKYRIPLDLIHITDLPPIVQPNLIGYVGHSGPMTPSLVGAAVLAATSSNNSYSHNNNNTASNMNPHEETPTTGLSASNLCWDFCARNANACIDSVFLIASEKFNFTNLSSSINVNHIRIFLRTPEEKADWIASLLSIQSYRLFIRYIRTLPRLEVSLRLPSSHIYKFSQPDSMDNIIFETNMPTSIFPPQIRMATLDKLIERLTYPTYFDTRLVNCFLLVYRRVTTSDELLDLLIERFRIPDPEFLPEEWNIEVEQGQLESPAQHMLKRFRSGYKKRIQSRVIMFLSRWVRNARYYQNDFAPNPRLRQKLLDFLSSIQARHLISSVERIKHYLQNPPISTQYPEAMTTTTIRTMETSKDNAELLSLLSSSDPTSVSSIESNQLRNFVNRITLNNIHPFKLAEQVTLYEWELYRRIPFWEVESRDRTGNAVPNLNKSKSFSNRFRSWLIYSILSEAHPDDRIVGIQRVIDLMLIMEHMNNLQGSQEAKSALISASVYRLRKSFQAIRRMRHYREIVDRLRRESIHNPKCQRTSSSSSSSLSHQNNPMIDSNLSANHSIHNNNTSNTTSNNNSSNHFAGFGLPFSTGTSKSHERRIRVLEKQHASGELCHPCVPYIAAGVITRLIHLDLRHPDTIINDAGNVMINCWKHRQLADIVERYLAFQRIPYTYNVDDNVRVSQSLLFLFLKMNVIPKEKDCVSTDLCLFPIHFQYYFFTYHYRNGFVGEIIIYR
ncbi:ras GTP exchange factor, son of sevenless,putative, partial [Schistosoma mansoni]|uniref:ras GTP exchange factor, son of sevenless,putative n=1 Tax=Schistosoma mansoni TaxID=6183 RepID=UPI00022C8517